MSTHQALRPSLLALLSVLTFSSAGTVCAQTAPLVSHTEPVYVRSGAFDNPTPVEGVVFRAFLSATTGSPWMRALFRKVHLDGDSYLRIASLRDGDFQTLHAEHVVQWQNATAFFNGDTLLLELIAGPRTTGNLVEVDQIVVGDVLPMVGDPDTICGATDDRVPATNPAAGRIVPVGCSGWIIQAPSAGVDRLHLSAGHCVAASTVLQFNVPASNTSCSLVQPPAASQFAIDPASLSNNGGVGNDYWVFKCFPNSTTGLTSYQAQGAAFALATALPSVGTVLRNTGYGVDGTPANGGANASSCSCASPNGARNQTQQTHTGNTVSTTASRVLYDLDTCGGNSGSVIANNTTGVAVAIHTHGGCTATGGTNSGTALVLPALQAAIASLSSGPIVVPNDECATPIALSVGTSATYSNAGATASAPAFACVAGGSDVWFSFTPNATASYTISTCNGARTFDTVMELFRGACTSLVSMACNDDDATCSTGSTVAFTLLAGQSYLLRVGGYNGAVGSFQVVITQGTFTGSIARVAHACGAATITPFGTPALGSSVVFTVSNYVGLPFVGIGFNTTPTPFCTCTLGHDWGSVIFGNTRLIALPVNASFLGAVLGVQGAVFQAAGGCASPQVVMTDTMLVTIG
jgi:hypothetical protein